MCRRFLSENNIPNFFICTCKKKKQYRSKGRQMVSLYLNSKISFIYRSEHVWNSAHSSASTFACCWYVLLSGSSRPCEQDSEFPGLSLPSSELTNPPPSASWVFQTMGSSCELVKLWNVTKDTAQSQMAPISPSNTNKVSWKEVCLPYTSMHRMIYINNTCTAAGTLAHKSSHTPSTATTHFPSRYMQHLYVNMFILTEICRWIAEECQVCWGHRFLLAPWHPGTY